MKLAEIEIPSFKRNHEYFLGLAEQFLDRLRLEAAARGCRNLEYDIQGLIDRLRERPDQTLIPRNEAF